MTIQLSILLRNARLDQIEIVGGTAPILTLRSGAQPADCATANSGSLLATLTLPSDWMGAAATGAKALAGSWSNTNASAGTVAHFRVHNADGANCYVQGAVTNTGGGGDMTLDNNILGAGQTVTITTFTITDGNA